MSERIPNLEDNSDYSRWKKAVKVWQLGTTAKKARQARRLIGFMSGRAYEAALQITPAELGADDGVDKLITELDSVSKRRHTQSVYGNWRFRAHYKRPEGVAMDLYVRDFEQKRKKIDQLRGQEVYEDGVLAYKLLNQATLPYFLKMQRLIKIWNLIVLRKSACPYHVIKLIQQPHRKLPCFLRGRNDFKQIKRCSEQRDTWEQPRVARSDLVVQITKYKNYKDLKELGRHPSADYSRLCCFKRV